MILYLQVFLTYTIQLYTYQRVFRDQKLNMKNFLTDGSSPTVPPFRKRAMAQILFNNSIFLISARDFGFPSIINQFVSLPPFRKRTMALILFALWTPNHNRRLIDGFSTAQRQHSKSPVRKVPCFSGRILSLSIIFTS